MKKTTILVLASNPLDLDRLDLGREIRTINDIRKASSQRDAFEVAPVPAARFRDVWEGLLDLDEVILHFSGHGFGDDGLAFEDDRGETRVVALEPFAGVLRVLRKTIRCVVLNACYSAPQAEQIKDFIPYVIGTTANLRDDQALEFSEVFYKGLFSGQSIPEAFELSRAVLRQDEPSLEAPDNLVLYPQPDTEPVDGTAGSPTAGGLADREMPKASPEWMAHTRQRLREAVREKARQRKDQHDTTAIDLKIVDIKREMALGPPLVEGDRLGSRFELIEIIGRGGYATVWRAYDHRHDHEVAVKLLHRRFGDDPTRREQFALGAKNMARMHHPGIVQVLDTELRTDTHDFFVMEYLAGGDLERFIQQARPEPDVCLDLAEGVADALVYAHREGWIHRDIKPANILIDDDGRAKLTDFDLVWARDASGITLTGDMLGTFGYSAPETMKKAGDIDERADVYGLGMTTIFALLADHPDIELLYRDPETLIAGLPVSPAIRAVLARSIHWHREDRTPSIARFLSELRAARRQPLMPPPAGEPARRTGDRSRSVNGMRFLPVPGGSYVLGSVELPDSDSEPVHRVVLNPYWITQTPVTNSQYRRFVEATGHAEPAFWNDAPFHQPEQPVVGVNWHDAVAYAQWTESQLPSEAQWEAAARGTDQRPYPWGHVAPSPQQANFGRTIGKPSAVDAFPAAAGPFGTFDQAGNIWEWCRDRWRRDAYQHRDGLTDPVWNDAPTTSTQVEERVLRGGSWADGAQFLHAACRYSNPVSSRLEFIGFRCILIAPG